MHTALQSECARRNVLGVVAAQLFCEYVRMNNGLFLNTYDILRFNAESVTAKLFPHAMMVLPPADPAVALHVLRNGDRERRAT